MNTLERRIIKLEAALMSRKIYLTLRRREAARAEERRRMVEEAARLEPILRDAPLRGAPQDEVVCVATPPEPAPPRPEEPRETRRLEGWAPAPTPVPPSTCDPPPEMQIRPVTWRRREASDYADDPDDMYGKCIVDYDPLAQEDADYYDDDDP